MGPIRGHPPATVCHRTTLRTKLAETSTAEAVRASGDDDSFDPDGPLRVLYRLSQDGRLGRFPFLLRLLVHREWRAELERVHSPDRPHAGRSIRSDRGDWPRGMGRNAGLQSLPHYSRTHLVVVLVALSAVLATLAANGTSRAAALMGGTTAAALLAMPGIQGVRRWRSGSRPTRARYSSW